MPFMQLLLNADPYLMAFIGWALFSLIGIVLVSITLGGRRKR
jgi:hypothetical protein